MGARPGPYKFYARLNNHPITAYVEIDLLPARREPTRALNVVPMGIPPLYNERKAAQLSTDSTHVVATGSGHSVQVDEPKIVSRGVSQLITAIRTDTSLPPCGRPWERLGAKCLS